MMSIIDSEPAASPEPSSSTDRRVNYGSHRRPAERYDLDAAEQFSLLAAHGLREHHKVLEIGCGGLGLGRLLIAFLRPGHYVAYDSDREIVEDAIERQCSPGWIEFKQPRLVLGSEPLGEVLTGHFDFIIATQALDGEDRSRQGELLLQLEAHLGAHGFLLLGPPDTTPERLAEAATSCGLTVEPGVASRPGSTPWPVLGRNPTANANTTSQTPDFEASRQRRTEEEIERYRNCENVHDLPRIFHTWSHHYLLPKLQACGFQSLEEIYMRYILDICRAAPDRQHTIASVGAGNCDQEVELAELARQAGVENFRFHCLELNPHMVERGRQLARHKGLEKHFEFAVIDIDQWRPERPLSVCFANHSLHHIVELELLFGKISEALDPQWGIFLTNDMIGRNGHMRWPEAQAPLEGIWRQMPGRYKYNHLLRRHETEYDNWDCSLEGNEGIRAQDILPLLMEYFHFDTFLAFSNIIDIFIDRAFGHNFDADDAGDTAFIHRVAKLDEEKILAGEVKPTHLIAAMRTRAVEKLNCYRHLTPEFCVRMPDQPFRKFPG